MNQLTTLLHTAFALYFGHESPYTCVEEVPLVELGWLETLLPKHLLDFEERVILLLALAPHLSPESLDLFFVQNKNLDRHYTEFGGWKGTSHSGFLPTGETAAFLLSVGRPQGRNTVIKLLSGEHWFSTENVLKLEEQGKGEPFLSGHLCVSDEFLERVMFDTEYRPSYNSNFPAKRITTPLSWDDLVLPYNLCEELESIGHWLQYQRDIRKRWALGRLIKEGYRCLFYGPPGTGKTLTAMLLGKQQGMDLYRVDLSMISSKYIGETEKNLAKVFDQAEHQNWILFFDEADALFGKRSETNSSNDRHANQEVAYLLQRIEDFPGMVILATNLKDNIDEAFFRRFQSTLYFPVPDQRLRYQLWEKMIPSEWLPEIGKEELLQQAACYDLSGGNMINVIQNCALRLHLLQPPLLTLTLLKQAIDREQLKTGKLIK